MVGLRLRRGVGRQFLRVILVVYVVAHTHEFSAIIAAGEEDDSDAEDLRRGNPLEVRGIGLEDKLVYPDGDGADQERVEFLVMLRARERSVTRGISGGGGVKPTKWRIRHRSVSTPDLGSVNRNAQWGEVT